MGNKIKSVSYELYKDGKVFKIEINKNIYQLKINFEKYILILDKYSKDIFIESGIKCKTLNELYLYIIDLFQKKKISLKDKIDYDFISLSCEINDKIYDLILEYASKRHLRPNFRFGDSYTEYHLDNTFAAFKSINDIYYIIYSNKKRDIIFFDLLEKEIINVIKNSHNSFITNFRHCLDDIKKRDLIMSLSSDDNNIKIWNINNFECLLNLTNFNLHGIIYSSCFLKENNQIYIVTSNYNENFHGNNVCESIKIYNLNGNQIKEINNSKYDTFFIDVYYEVYNNNKYIITGNKRFIKSYDYDKNETFNIYIDNQNSEIISLDINDRKENIKLISSGRGGYIKIWNFISGELLKIIDSGLSENFGICRWNSNRMYIGAKNFNILVINQEELCDKIWGYHHITLTLKKIVHPKYGECLIGQGYDGPITIWN